jgi:hypothetical protein
LAERRSTYKQPQQIWISLLLLLLWMLLHRNAISIMFLITLLLLRLLWE